MTIGTTGNVGIGTTAPVGVLDVRGANTLPTAVQIGGTSANSGNLISLQGNATNGGAVQIYSNYFSGEGPLILGSYTNRSNQLTLAVSGNVGIGTTSPTTKLDVVGAVTVSTYIKVPAVAVTSLPAAATAGVGARAFVNDALAPVFGSTVATGGAVAVPVYSDGSAWKVG
jgi:hypothetical protein